MRMVRFVAGELGMVIAVAIFLLAFGASAAGAKGLPADVCTLLSSAQLQKTLGQAFGPAVEATAPAAYRGQSSGKNCTYTALKDRDLEVTLIFYVDKSPSEAKETFQKLSMWFPPKSRPSGIGDSAYLDSNHAVHVLKGSDRYFISIGSRASAAVREKQEQELAIAVAAEI
ncbi:MAG: hypothetical protein WCE61_17055 [Candidatus Acidiferrum sp.]